jgi:uncharacterized protein (DUF1778 family)
MATRDKLQRRDVSINLRAPAPIAEMIDRAAGLLGKSRNEFMLDSARKCAVDILLDQRIFGLDEKSHAALLMSLTEPPKPAAQLQKLLASKSRWER